MANLYNTNFFPYMTLTGHIQGGKEQFDLIKRLSSKNWQKAFVLLGRRSLSSDVVCFRLVKDLKLVEVVDEPRDHRVQTVQQEDVVFTNPFRAFNVRVTSFLNNTTDKHQVAISNEYDKMMFTLDGLQTCIRYSRSKYKYLSFKYKYSKYNKSDKYVVCIKLGHNQNAQLHCVSKKSSPLGLSW